MLPSTEEELERAAEEMRLEWQLDRQDVPDVLTMLAKLKAAGRIANYERVPDDELP